MRRTLTARSDDSSLAKWIRGSKVVDRAGNPLPVYHASRADIHQFAFQPRQYKRLDFVSFEDHKWNVLGLRYDGSKTLEGELWHLGNLWILHQFGQLERLDANNERDARREAALYINPYMPVSERVAAGFRVFFFSEESRYAHGFSTWHSEDKTEDNRGVLYKCYLRVLNPMLPTEPHWKKMEQFYVRSTRGPGQQALMERCRTLFLNGRWEVKEAYPGFVEAAKHQGFDGFLSYEGSSSAFNQMDDDGRDPAKVRVWGVFYSSQIKSVFNDKWTNKPGLLAMMTGAT